MDNPYSVLGLAADADTAVVKAAYRTLAKKHHPDQGGDLDDFKRVEAAYNAIIQGKPFIDNSSKAQSSDGLFGGIFSSEPVETKTATGIPNYGITVEGEYLTATIIGLQEQVNIQNIVFDHQLNERPGSHRTVILYDFENTSNQILSWHSDESTYIGSDGYTYDHSEYLADDAGLRPPWTSYYVDIEGNARARFIEIVEHLPDEVTVNRIIHKLHIYAPGRTSGWVEDQERFEFDIKNGDRRALEQPPV